MQPHEIPFHWPVPEPSAITPLSGGINNQTSRVFTPGGDYILRVCRPTVNPAAVAAIYANLAGQYLAGGLQELAVYGVESALALEDWLERNGDQLVARALTYPRE